MRRLFSPFRLPALIASYDWHVPFVSLVSTIGLFLFSVLLALPGTAQARPKITLPLVPGFYDGQRIFYINTEASDPGLAAADGTTFVPKLANAIAAGALASMAS